MGLLDFLLQRQQRTRKPAPPFEVHEYDSDLLRQSDIDWWDHLSLKAYAALQKSDQVNMMYYFLIYTEKEGLDAETAAKKVRLTVISYYRRCENRSPQQLNLDEEDASLPVALRGRVNKALLRSRKFRKKIKENLRNNSSSANALVRELIRNEVI